MSRFRAPAASRVALGAGLAAVAFGAGGGQQLGSAVLVQVLLVVAGAGAVCAAILLGEPGRLHGGPALALFAVLAALTGLSITWSISPELSFVEAGRTLAYLAVFAGALAAARLAPRGAPALLHGLLIGAAAVCLYALASRVWPGALAETELSNRIGKPYDYWNAVGTTAAMLVPAGLWLGSRRGSVPPMRALAYPVVGIAILTILLTQSRGALLAALLGAIAWLAIVPLRLRSLPVLLIPALGAAPVAVWALSKDAFSKSLQPLAVKEAVAGELGLLLILMICLLYLSGLAVALGMARVNPSAVLRRRVGMVAIVAACAVPLALFAAVAFSERGLGGTVEDRFDELTNEAESAPVEGGGRLTAAQSSRAKYWREAGEVFGDRPGIGTGAGTFGLSRLRYRKDELVSRHAHGFIAQTLADMGLVGLAAALALLAAWLASAARATALYPRIGRGAEAPRERRDWTSERIAVVCAALVALVYGFQGAIDWTWFVPGPTVMALVAAGFVAGRGPLVAAPDPATPLTDPESARPRRRILSVGRPEPERARLVLTCGVTLTAVLFAWAIWQPEASERKSSRALELISEGDLQAAIVKADAAHDANPLSPKPLLVKAVAQTGAAQTSAARRSLETAVLRYPGEPQTWLRLTSFELGTVNRPAAALETVRGALYLDPKSKTARRLYLEALSRLRDQATERASRRRS